MDIETNRAAILTILNADSDFLIGCEDASEVVEAWRVTGLSVERIGEWISARCFDAASASGLELGGFTPAQCSEDSAMGDTLAYAYCNGDEDLEGIRLIVSGELAEARRIAAAY